MLSKKADHPSQPDTKPHLTTTYGTRYFAEPVPRFRVPESSMSAEAAYQIIHDELNLDANPALNLASFVTTWMEPEAQQLLKDSANKNFVDEDEYPQTKQIHDRLITMMAHLFNAPEECQSVGTATIGSSEAIMLGNLAHKRSWQNRRKAQGKPCDKPNLIFGADVHTCWEKFARYFDVEMRVIPMENDKYIINADDVAERLDENTISVGCILGTTFTGQMDDIQGINDLLVEHKKKTGDDIPVHVDAASGGFIAPFVYPEVEWDFRLEQVRSINISNHKFGLVYPGMGTVLFRDKSDLPDDLVFHINYLGGDMPNYSLNFSRASSMVLLQYYNFLRLGISGYRDIMHNIMANAQYLEKQLIATDRFELLNESKYLPVVVVRLKNEENFTVYDLSDRLRERGWIVPAYALPPNAEEVSVLRMVVKENFSHDMAETFTKDVVAALKKLDEEHPKPEHPRADGSKHRVC